MTVSYDLIEKVCKAIAVAEGYGKPGPSQHANNPGNITDDGDVGCGVCETHGKFGAKITIYPTPDAGWAALERKVRRMLSGASHTYTLDMTVMEVALKWSGDPNWGLNVARCLDVAPDTSLATIVANDPKSNA
jgi:hypothetical protein